MPEFKTVRGMRDFLPEEAYVMRYVEAKAREVAQVYTFKEIITPIVESCELLSAKSGEEIRKRMFVFKDLGGREIALRPEFTASVARLVATTFRNEPKPFRLFSVGSIYRYDEPQKGRYREFYQSNYELMGSNRPEADAEILMLTNSLMKKVGLKNWAFKIGHIGILKGIFEQEKLKDKVQNSVMQLMDKKQHEEALQIIEDAGISTEALRIIRELLGLRGANALEIVENVKKLICAYPRSVASAQNLGDIIALVNIASYGMNITLDAGFARGLEYYTGMIFEVYVPDLEIALGGGGRYDKLIELFGGTPTPAVGVAHGIDRIMLSLQGQKIAIRRVDQKTALIIATKDEFRGEALRISEKLRTHGILVLTEVSGRKMAKALEDADKRKLDFAVIIGEKELKNEAVMLRNLTLREQSTVKIDDLAAKITRADKP
jgi:histidyl-tRNA synthetase